MTLLKSSCSFVHSYWIYVCYSTFREKLFRYYFSCLFTNLFRWVRQSSIFCYLFYWFQKLCIFNVTKNHCKTKKNQSWVCVEKNCLKVTNWKCCVAQNLTYSLDFWNFLFFSLFLAYSTWVLVLTCVPFGNFSWMW